CARRAAGIYSLDSW
nr:immunoglobulin heavy chain junction region [Macaca mulatta]